MLNKFNRSKGPRRGQISSGGPARGRKSSGNPFQVQNMGMGFAGGGKMKTKGYAGGGKIRMSPKMMANGGPTGAVKRDNSKSDVARGSGAARPQPFRKNG